MSNDPIFVAQASRPRYVLPERFEENSAPVSLFYAPSKADVPTLVMNRDYNALFLQNSTEGLVLGRLRDQGMQHTIAASGVPIPRHTLVALDQNHTMVQIGYPLDNQRLSVSKCVATMRDGNLTYSPEGSIIEPTRLFLKIDGPSVFRIKSISRDQADINLASLLRVHPESVVILLSYSRDPSYITITPTQTPQDFRAIPLVDSLPL